MADPKKIVVLRPDALERAGRSVAFDELRTPLVTSGLARWNELRGDRDFPPRSMVTANRFKTHLRNLALIGVVEDGADFEFRIVGDAFLVVHGFSAHGMRTSQVDALSPGYGTASRRLFERVRSTGRPLALHGSLETAERQSTAVNHESIYLPLGQDGDVDHILCIASFSPALDTQ